MRCHPIGTFAEFWQKNSSQRAGIRPPVFGLVNDLKVILPHDLYNQLPLLVQCI